MDNMSSRVINYIEELLDSMFLHVLGDLIDLGLVLLVDAKMLHQSLCVHILFRKKLYLN